jgi:uncharacterized protein (TIGR00730 family)
MNQTTYMPGRPQPFAAVPANTAWIAVFCASSHGSRPEYQAAARKLGSEFGTRSLGLVYGGASVGLMGTLADAALAAGAPVVGVLPSVLKDREIAHGGLTELHFVESMHERKALMAERASAFVALPGGYGTLDEFLEILTWAQLGIHSKTCVLVNLLGFYDGLLSFLDHAVAEGFIRPTNRALIEVAQDVPHALDLVQAALLARGPRQ